jgi:hypothetical protein
MHTNISKLENIINNREYTFLCEIDSPLDDAEEALFRKLDYIRKFRESVKTKLKEQQQQEQSKVESIPEAANV